jgi:prevent-host-death family protein
MRLCGAVLRRASDWAVPTSGAWWSGKASLRTRPPDDYNDYHDYFGGIVDIWTVAKAKAKLSELIDQAQKQGPQTITRNGHKAVVVVSTDEWDRKTKRTGSLAEFLAASPLRGSGLKIKRSRQKPRAPEL